MADHSITVTGSVRCFGGGPASLWNQYNWGSFNWGEGTATIPHDVLHLMPTTMTLSSTRGFQVLHLLDGESLAVTTEPLKSVYFQLPSETLSLSGDLDSEGLSDGRGYSYVFPGQTTEGESRFSVTWSSAGVSATSWTSVAQASTTWSES